MSVAPLTSQDRHPAMKILHVFGICLWPKLCRCNDCTASRFLARVSNYTFVGPIQTVPLVSAASYLLGVVGYFCSVKHPVKITTYFHLVLRLNRRRASLTMILVYYGSLMVKALGYKPEVCRFET
jgi:hypothetical protein